MLIRSQDKMDILDITGKRIYSTTAGDILITNNAEVVNGDCLLIGKYKTKERAIEVLDDICRAYECSLYCEHGFDSAAALQRPYIFAQNRVYQMPEE